MKRAGLFVLAAVGMSSLSSGCAVMAVAGAAGAGVMAVQDRSIGRGIDDAATSSAVKRRLMAFDSRAFSSVDVEVAEGQVLLSGATPTDQDRRDAERIAWGVEGAGSVSNQITVGRQRTFAGNAHDQWITARIRAKLVSDAAVKGVNLNIETQDGVVYLMGLVRTEEEMRRAAETAAYVGGVKKVVSYMQVRAAQPNRPILDGAAPIEMTAPAQAEAPSYPVATAATDTQSGSY